MNTPIGFPGLGLELHLSSKAFSMFGHNIQWYGIIIAIAFLLAAAYVMRRAPRVGIKGDDIIDGLLFAVPVSIICARLYYVVFNFARFSPSNPHKEKIYAIWNGGIAIYGALIGAVLVAYIFCRVRKIKFTAYMDVFAPGLFIGQCLGRWGNFFNQEAFGSETSLPWRMNLYVSEMNGRVIDDFIDVHPTFLYESLWCLAGFLLLHFLFFKRKFNGQIVLIYVAWYGLGRSFIEGLRTDSLYLGNSDLRVSQLLSVLFCLTALVLLAYNFFMKEHGPDELLAPLAIGGKEPQAEDPVPE